ncbi:MAG: hypothetical protein Q9178_005926 [Gyalolechia marmorata]
MLFRAQVLFIFNILASQALSAAPSPPPPSPPSTAPPHRQLNPHLSSSTTFGLPSTTYTVPHTNVRVTLNVRYYGARSIPPASLQTLITTGLAALGFLAARAGGWDADLDVPRLRWDNAGLTIFMNDGTLRNPQAAGGPFRFDEMRAVYEAVGAATGRIGYRECSIVVWRISNVLSRKVKFLGWGHLTLGDVEGARGGGGGGANRTWSAVG